MKKTRKITPSKISSVEKNVVKVNGRTNRGSNFAIVTSVLPMKVNTYRCIGTNSLSMNLLEWFDTKANRENSQKVFPYVNMIEKHGVSSHLNPMALRKAKIVHNSGLSESNRVKQELSLDRTACLISCFGNTKKTLRIIVVVVVLFFYFHCKHLRSCQDDQLT